jgi:magnesium transporter
VFRVLDLPKGGAPILRGDDDAIGPPPPGTTRWVDLIAPDPAALAILQERFAFDPIAILDCSRYGTQSKLDDYGAYLFVVAHGFTAATAVGAAADLSLQIHEVHAFLGVDYLVTVHDNPVPAQEQVWDTAALDKTVLERGASWALYKTITAMLSAAEPLVETMIDDLDAVELRLIHGDDKIDLTEVFRLKRTMVAARRVLKPLRDTLTGLHRRGDPRISARTMLYFRDATAHVARLTDMLEQGKEVAVSVINAHGAVQSQKVNEVMKRLTIFSAIFLPLSFIVGFFGQNFDDLPIHGHSWWVLMLISMIVIPAALLEWFKRNDWL